mmetsp:Transcript_23992/g.72248  ORF Transcript_23992/g.72248 Transcript_23992/m.72248 type:complete len:280 (-) Transcript_23992:403-1242(-)
MWRRRRGHGRRRAVRLLYYPRRLRRGHARAGGCGHGIRGRVGVFRSRKERKVRSTPQARRRFIVQRRRRRVFRSGGRASRRKRPRVRDFRRTGDGPRRRPRGRPDLQNGRGPTAAAHVRGVGGHGGPRGLRDGRRRGVALVRDVRVPDADGERRRVCDRSRRARLFARGLRRRGLRPAALSICRPARVHAGAVPSELCARKRGRGRDREGTRGERVRALRERRFCESRRGLGVDVFAIRAPRVLRRLGRRRGQSGERRGRLWVESGGRPRPGVRRGDED